MAFLFIILVLVNLSVIIYIISLFSKSPFISVPKKFLPEIVKALDLKEASVLYDLGSGDGRVLFAAAKAWPKAKFVGIDKNFAPIVVSKVKWLLSGMPANISFIRQDFFKTDFSEATHIFTYLFDGPMAELYPIMQKQLRSGTRIVSCNFRLPIPHQSEVVLGNLEDKAAKKLYLYKVA
ncbi:MAG: hypothetical protein JWO40_470 [Candidatus Doudnabacteria bacterium]|nr:hypothetical protein [Candidatus Doudnabacteria bacterium]